MKITFSDWSIPASGIDCEVVFISVTDLALAGSLEQETKKKSVSFCGKNPGNGLNLTRCALKLKSSHRKGWSNGPFSRQGVFWPSQ